MADNTQEETGYTEQSQSAFAEEAVVIEKNKGKGGRLIMVAAGAFLLLLVGLFAFSAYKKSTSPTQPAAPAATQAPAGQSPAPASVDPALDPAAAPVDQAPADPAAPALSDAELFGGPVNAQPVFQDPTQQPALPGQPVFQDPAATLPADALQTAPAPTGQQPPSQADNPFEQAPAVQQPTTPDPAVQVTVQTDPAPTAPVSDAVSALDQVRNDIMAGFDELRSAIEGLSDRQAKFETATNDRFDKIEDRLSGVESGRSASSSAKPSSTRDAKVAAASKPRAKPASRPRKPAAPAHRNTFEIIAPARSFAPAAPVALVPTGPAVLIQDRSLVIAERETSFCPPSAVQPGRFWVRQPDGSFRTYGEGDRFGAGVISKVDPADGIFVDGVRVCSGR